MILCHLHMPLYFLGTFTEYPNCNKVTIEYGAERNLYKLRSAILGTLD